MKDKIQSDCNKLHKLMQDVDALKADISKDISLYAEENRVFFNDEVVAVCDRDTDKEIGRGIVSSVRTLIHLEPIWLKSYTDFEKFSSDIDNLRYEIYAIKKDGTKSTKHFFHMPHFIGTNTNKKFSDVYIRKI